MVNLMADIPLFVSEFVGTFILVFTVGCNVLGNKGSPWIGTSIACSLMVGVYALGGVSGAHFNPAVSFCLGCSNQKSWPKVIEYWVAQFAGAGSASLLTLVMFHEHFEILPAAGFGIIQVVLAETLYTFMLCFVVLNVACSQGAQGKEYYGLAIGFVIVAGAYGAGAISGGAFNPAVAAGGVELNIFWTATYMAAELLGAAIAAGAYRVVRPAEFSMEVPPLASKLLSEFLGTFFLVLTVGLNVLGKSAAGAFSIAASLMCMIYALGDVSGANFNPAVTLAILLSKRNKISPADAGAYIAVQLVGGVVGSFFAIKMRSDVEDRAAMFHLGARAGPADNIIAVIIGEMMFTFVLAFVVLSVATKFAPNTHMFGLAIGACVTAGGNAIGAISGGSLNPAVTLGLAVGGGGSWMELLIYWVAELAGGALAAGIFFVTNPQEYKDEPLLG